MREMRQEASCAGLTLACLAYQKCAKPLLEEQDAMGFSRVDMVVVGTHFCFWWYANVNQAENLLTSRFAGSQGMRNGMTPRKSRTPGQGAPASFAFAGFFHHCPRISRRIAKELWAIATCDYPRLLRTHNLSTTFLDMA